VRPCSRSPGLTSHAGVRFRRVRRNARSGRLRGPDGDPTAPQSGHAPGVPDPPAPPDETCFNKGILRASGGEGVSASEGVSSPCTASDEAG
jgi:hypothetical protein